LALWVCDEVQVVRISPLGHFEGLEQELGEECSL
jgi:hypothetical protein